MPDEILSFRFQNLHEFVKVARQNLDRNNWDYLIGGSESETTLARNRLALDSLGFRPRVLRDVSNVDCSRTLFGKKLRLPVLCAPVGSLQNFDPGGGATVAAAPAEFGNGRHSANLRFARGSGYDDAGNDPRQRGDAADALSRFDPGQPRRRDDEDRSRFAA